MADDRVVNEIVTKFLLNTCELRQNVNKYMSASTYLRMSASKCTLDEDEADVITLTTGSVAEFYIHPMFSCVSDIDIMFHRGDELAIPAGTAPPTQLPAEFHSHVNVFEITDSEFPGYVYLVSSYLLKECSDDGKYNAVQLRRWYAPQIRAVPYLNMFDIGELYMGQRLSLSFRITLGCFTGVSVDQNIQETQYPAYGVCCGRHKPLIGQKDRETTAGQTQQLLIVLSAMDVMWLVWHIVSVEKING